jgi:hypothetical protein
MPELSPDCHFEPYLIHMGRAGRKPGGLKTPSAPSEFHKSHHHQQYSHEVYSTAYPAFPKKQEGLTLPSGRTTSPHSCLPRCRPAMTAGSLKTGPVQVAGTRWSVSLQKHLQLSRPGSTGRRSGIPCSALVHKG